MKGINKIGIIGGVYILLLVSISPDVFGVEPSLEVQIIPEGQFYYPGQVFYYNVLITNDGPEDAYNSSIVMNLDGPGTIRDSPLPFLDCTSEIPTISDCLIIDPIAQGETVDIIFIVDIDPEAAYGESFTAFFDVYAESIDELPFLTGVAIDSTPSIPQADQADIRAFQQNNTYELTVSPGESFIVVIGALNYGPADAESVVIEYELLGPGVISEESLPAECQLDGPTLAICQQEILFAASPDPPDNYDIIPDEDSRFESELTILVDTDAANGEEFSHSINVYSQNDDFDQEDNTAIFPFPDVVALEEPLPQFDLVADSSLESGVDSIIPGQKFSQTITVLNYGPEDALLVNIVNTISGPGNISESDMPQECFVNPLIQNQIICSLGVIENQKGKQVTLYWIINSDAKVGQLFGNEFIVTSTDDSGDNPNGSFRLEIILPEISEDIDPVEELQKRIKEQQRVKSLQELEALLSQKLTILNEKESVYLLTLSTNDISEITFAQKQFLDAKIDYIQTLQEYLEKKPNPTFEELEEMETLLEELKTEYEEFAYSQIFNEIAPAIVNPVTEDFDSVEPPILAPKDQDPQLYLLEQAFDTSAEAAEGYAESQGLAYQEGKTRVLVEVTDEQQFQKLEEFATIETFVGNFAQVEISVSDLKKIRDADYVDNYRPPTIALQNSIGNVISEGIPVINADLVQLGGYTGKGVKVAVLDLAFDQNNKEISDNIKETKSFRYDLNDSLMPLIGPDDNQYQHGTGVAEIIVDVAPDVNLHLYSMGTEIEFTNAVDYAMSQGVDVIAMSAGWLNYPTDGSSPMTKKIEEAIDSGIVFVVSSGNYAQTHWEGKFQDNDNNYWHEFSGKDEGLTFSVGVGEPILVYLLWYGDSASSEDYDLIMTDSEGRDVSSESNLSRSKNKLLLESIYFIPKESGDYSLGITYGGDTPKATLEVFSPFNALEYTTPSGSVGVPTDAKGLIVTGAVHYKKLSLEFYSSQGPTNHGTKVPTVVAPDSVTTEAMPVFQGTSAAAPHVAGVAALLLEKQPTATPAEIKKLLEINADKESVKLSATYDTLLGHGKIDSGFIIGSQKIPDWIKNNAGWWAADQIDDSSFIQGIQYLIKEGIMIIPPTTSGEAKSDIIPEWIKNNAGWWAAGDIDDNSFLQGIQYLIKEGILTV